MRFFHLIIATQHCHSVCIHATWASLTHIIAYGLPWPTSSYLSIFGPFSFLGHPRPIPILHFHGFLLSLLGFPDPITISFAFGVQRLSINLLLTYFITLGLPRPILTFILPIGLLLLSPGSFKPTCFLWGPFLILWVYNPLFLSFRFNGFSLNLLTLFYSYCWICSRYWTFPKRASTKGKLQITHLKFESIWILHLKVSEFEIHTVTFGDI